MRDPHPGFAGVCEHRVLDTAGKAVTGAPALNTAATAKYNVGTYPITVAIGTLAAANYNFMFVPGTLTITPAVLTVTASNRAAVYGAALPGLGYAITGFVNGDLQIHAVTGTPALTTTPKGSAAGVYPITASLGTLAARDYTFTFVSGTLTISKAMLSVTATSLNKVYGAALPTLSSVITGFVNGDTAATAVTGVARISTAATAASPVGT